MLPFFYSLQFVYIGRWIVTVISFPCLLCRSRVFAFVFCMSLSLSLSSNKDLIMFDDSGDVGWRIVDLHLFSRRQPNRERHVRYWQRKRENKWEKFWDWISFLLPRRRRLSRMRWWESNELNATHSSVPRKDICCLSLLIDTILHCNIGNQAANEKKEAGK